MLSLKNLGVPSDSSASVSYLVSAKFTSNPVCNLANLGLASGGTITKPISATCNGDTMDVEAATADDVTVNGVIVPAGTTCTATLVPASDNTYKNQRIELGQSGCAISDL